MNIAWIGKNPPLLLHLSGQCDNKLQIICENLQERHSKPVKEAAEVTAAHLPILDKNPVQARTARK